MHPATSKDSSRGTIHEERERERENRPRGFRSRSDRPAAIEERRIGDGGPELSAHPLLVQYALREGKGERGEERVEEQGGKEKEREG